jgi:hypothetical protein
MNEYQKALIVLRESSDGVSKANKLIKISVLTEDKTFAKYLDAVIEVYKKYIKPGWYRKLSTGDKL